MADNEFNLGEAYGGLQQAKADRDFYLSMVQGGTQAASPIAAYLAGVAGVKMANMSGRLAEAQQALRDEGRAEQDAITAAQRARRHGETLRNNLLQIVRSANEGKMAKGAAATMVGALVKELGYTPVDYDADNSIISYADANGEQYELDLSTQPKPSTSRATTGAASKNKYTTLAGFNSSHREVNKAFGNKFKMDKLSKGQVQAFIEGAEGLSPQDRQSVQAKVDELLKFAGDKGWSFSSPTSPTSQRNVLGQFYK